MCSGLGLGLALLGRGRALSGCTFSDPDRRRTVGYAEHHPVRIPSPRLADAREFDAVPDAVQRPSRSLGTTRTGACASLADRLARAARAGVDQAPAQPLPRSWATPTAPTRTRAADRVAAPAEATKIERRSSLQAAWLAAEAAAADGTGKAALGTTGLHALLLGSMSVAAAQLRDRGDRHAARRRSGPCDDAQPPQLLSDVEAVQAAGRASCTRSSTATSWPSGG